MFFIIFRLFGMKFKLVIVFWVVHVWLVLQVQIQTLLFISVRVIVSSILFLKRSSAFKPDIKRS